MNLRCKHKGVSPSAGRSSAKLLLEVNPFGNGSGALLGSGCEFLTIIQQPAPQNATWLMPTFERSRTTLESPKREWSFLIRIKSPQPHFSFHLEAHIGSPFLSLLLCSSSFPQSQIPRWIFSPALKTHSEMPEKTLLIMPEGKKIPAEHICLMSPW